MEDKILDQNELCEYLGMSRVKLWRLQKDAAFPKPFLLGNTKKWRRSEIDAYLEGTRRIGEDAIKKEEKE